MVKFLDLSAEIEPIRHEIDSAINKIINKCNFIYGEEVHEFETQFAKYINRQHCIGVANGTDALEIAIQALILNGQINAETDTIITQANTFISTCLGATYNNIDFNLIDIDQDTFQIDLLALDNSLEVMQTNPFTRPKVLVIVHLTGSSCDMNELMRIIRKYNLILIEDCAQSHGATFNGQKLGSFGDISTFSFYPGKNLGAFGDGGAICVDSPELKETISKIRNLGSIKKYHHEIIGRNSRLDTLQATILSVKLQYLDENNQKRRERVHLYNQLLSDISEIEVPKITQGCEPVYHLYMIKCRPSDRDELKKYLEDHNVGVGIHYPIPIAELKCFEITNFFYHHVKESIECSSRILSLPMYPNLQDKEIIEVCKLIKEFFQERRDKKEESIISFDTIKYHKHINIRGLRYPKIIYDANTDKLYLFGGKCHQKQNNIDKYLPYRYELNEDFQVIPGSEVILDLSNIEPEYQSNIYKSIWFRSIYTLSSSSGTRYYCAFEVKTNIENKTFIHDNFLMVTEDFTNFQYVKKYQNRNFIFYDGLLDQDKDILLTSAIESTDYFWGNYLFEFFQNGSKYIPYFDNDMVNYDKDKGHVLHNVLDQISYHTIIFSIRHKVDDYVNYSNNEPYMYKLYTAKTYDFINFYETHEIQVDDSQVQESARSTFYSYPSVFTYKDQTYIIANQDEFGKSKEPILFVV
jgi:dTDP-4-amino-4,6-dideoxygalactose transaminase